MSKDRNTLKRSISITNNVAKFSIEFFVTLKREQLRPEHGETFWQGKETPKLESQIKGSVIKDSKDAEDKKENRNRN